MKVRNGASIDAEHAEPVLDFVRRARERLAPVAPELPADPAVIPSSGDHALAPEIADIAKTYPPQSAAVLVPVIARQEPTILLTQRSAALSNHAGQISFPGGKLDSADPDPLATALREAQEEIGLDSGYADPLGYLDPYLSGTGFRIVPVVALISPAFQMTINPAEVDEAFEVPLSFLMTPENHARHSREWKGVQRSFYAMPYGERYIWGITAGILRRLYERLYR
ncbi:MAG: CoA pyrophosphatase [Xanthobacteraceae bacterium]